MEDLDKPLPGSSSGTQKDSKDQSNQRDRDSKPPGEQSRNRSRNGRKRGGKKRGGRNRRGERSSYVSTTEDQKMTHRSERSQRDHRERPSTSSRQQVSSRRDSRRYPSSSSSLERHRSDRSRTQRHASSRRHRSPSLQRKSSSRRDHDRSTTDHRRSNRSTSHRNRSRSRSPPATQHSSRRDQTRRTTDESSRRHGSSRHHRDDPKHKSSRRNDSPSPSRDKRTSSRQPKREKSYTDLQEKRKRERERDEERRGAISQVLPPFSRHPDESAKRGSKDQEKERKRRESDTKPAKEHLLRNKTCNDKKEDTSKLTSKISAPPEPKPVEKSAHKEDGYSSSSLSCDKVSNSARSASKSSQQSCSSSSCYSSSSRSGSSRSSSYDSRSRSSTTLKDELLNGPSHNSNISHQLQQLSAPGVVHPTLEHPQNYEESIRKLENTENALKEKELLKKYSLEKGAIIDVKLFVGQVPKQWSDENVLTYFQKLGQVLEARVIRDKYDGTHRGCAFLRVKMFHEAELMLDSHRPRSKHVAEDEGLNSRLQIRFADGELERLGIVNIDLQEQTRLYVQNLDKQSDYDVIASVFNQFGEVEEIHMFRDQFEHFKGSITLRYKARKQALKAIQFLSMKGMADNRFSAQLVEKSIQNQLIEVRFTDRKRNNNKDPSQQQQRGQGQGESQYPTMQQQQMPQGGNFVQQFPQQQQQVGMTWPQQMQMPHQMCHMPMQQQQQQQQQMYPLPQQQFTPAKSFSIPVVPSPQQASLPQNQFASFFRSLIPNPSKQHLFLKYLNEGTPYYLDTVSMQSQWQEPPNATLQGLEVIILNGQTVNLQLTQYLQQREQALHCIQTGQYKQGPAGANLFIFHLPNEWSDMDLFNFFSEQNCGIILSVRIMTDKASGRSKGYGFVSYETADNAAMAIQQINGKQALGKRLKVELKKGGISQAMNYSNDGEEGMSDTDSVVQQILGKDDANQMSMTNMIYEGTTGANSSCK